MVMARINFLKYRKIYFSFSFLLIVFTIVLLIFYRLNLGVDFLGGSLLEVEFQEKRPVISELEKEIKNLGFKEILIRPIGERGVMIILKEKDISEKKKNEILKKISFLSPLKEKNYYFETISPSVGKELTRKARNILFFTILAILFYLAYAFRKLKYSISPFEYGMAGVIALFHDVFLTLGVLILLGKFYGLSINIPIVCALLTIFAYSINDTVVVFDRIRENLIKRSLSFKEAINEGISQSIIRSLNTSFTTLFVLLAIFFFAGEELKYFALTLILGISLGTYSSLFLASPLLYFWKKT